jgi:N-methylhydantoinase B
VVRCAVKIAGEDIFIDFTGSSPQSTRGINVVLNYTHAYASFAIKAAICPEVPHNEGSFRPVHVSAPPGSILNALDPAPVASRQVIGHFIPSAIFAALSGALPGRLMAPGADPIWLSVWRGQNPPFTLTIFQVGGTGARPTKDGLNAVGFPSGVAGVPAEVIESLSPVVMKRRQLRPDSGGAGTWRGGLGQLTEFARRGDGRWSVSSIADRTAYAAPGLLGGREGATGEVRLGDGTRLNAKALKDLKNGEIVHVNLPGGGGYGDPLKRDPEKVRWDVVEGYITAAEAEKKYGVAVRYTGEGSELVKLPENWVIDQARTAELRG